MPAPQVTLFNETAQMLRIARARQRQSRSTPFLIDRVVDDLCERLLDIKRPFARACLIGPFDWREDIMAALPDKAKIAAFDWAEQPEGDGYDLVISLLHLQSINTVGGWMQGVRAMLVPDGLFIASLIGGVSLNELRHALYAIDTDRAGSPTPRIHPMIEVRAAAQLLGHIGLALPVTDSDRFTVHYRKVETLAADLRDLGLTNSLRDRNTRPTPTLIQDIEAQLRPAPGEPMPLSWEIVWMTGWAPHESQQKPLKPGSAKVGLNDALKVIRGNSD
ncbi:MAG: SAM-dependent methyltransferase [Litorimonas sp.]